MRGSGLHYSTLAPAIARAVTPGELALLVEAGDANELAHLVGIDTDRASRVVEHLASTGLEDVIASPLEDAVELSLLDGGEYKSTERVSTGQRCTVVLPILLAHRERTLIVDQPEDHLDNAFIVETVIKAIRSRGNDAQLLFSTHNPNIPVLGDAELVVLLGSDGTRGFVQHAERLEHPASVDAISTVMEGGREAFEQRAAFYHRGALLP